MFSQVIQLFLSLFGLTALLYYILFRSFSWKHSYIFFTLPLYGDEQNMIDEIIDLRRMAEISGTHRKMTLIIINYGASEEYCEKIMLYFHHCGDFIRIISPDDEKITNGEIFLSKKNDLFIENHDTKC